MNKDCVTRGNLIVPLYRLFADRAFRLAYNRHASIHKFTTLYCCNRNASNMAAFIICRHNDVAVTHV